MFFLYFGLAGHASAATAPTATWNVTNDGTGHVTELTSTYSAGTIVGSPSATTGPNSSGAALSLGSGQAVDLGHNFQFGSSDFTLALWLKTTSGQIVVAVGENSGLGNNIWCGIFNGPKATCSATGSGGSYTISNSAGYNDGNWHLFGIIRRGTSLYMSIDGVDSSPTVIGASGETFNPTGNLYLNQFGSAGGFSGTLSLYEAGVWLGAGLTSTEMAAKFATPGTLWINSTFTAGTIYLTSKNSSTINLSATAARGNTSPYTYQWYRSTSTGFTPGPSNILTGQTNLTLNDTGLTASTPYYYKIRATDNVSATADSTEFTTTTDAIATSFTFTGPTSGGINSVSPNFTITPNGEYSGIIIPASTGSGTFSPSSLTWSASSVAQTFNYTPTSTSGSPHTISVSSSPTLTNSSGTISYTVNNFFYNNNFDSETTGALPTGWANIGTATWKVGTTNPISGAKDLEDPIFHVGGIAVYTGVSAVADSAGQISQVVHLNESLQGANTGLFLRVSSDGNNGYLFAPNFAGGTLSLFKKVNGSYTGLDGTSMGLTWTDGDIALIKAEVFGTTLRWKVWKSTGSEPGSWTYSTTDSSVSAAGYIGLYEGFNGISAGSTISSIDDIYWGHVTSSTSFTFTGPTSGVLNSASTNFTINPNGLYTGTITPSSTGSGTFSPTSLSWDSSLSPQTFTYTPTSRTGSPHTISVSSSPTLTNSSGTISYTVSIGNTTIAVNNAAWTAGLSPYNWYVSGSTYMQSINPGAYFKVKFTGTSASLGVNVSAMSGVVAKRYPRITYQIDGGSWQTYQLLSTDTQVSLGSSLTDTTHDLEVIFLSSDAYTTKWDGTMSLKITGLIIDTGKTLSAATMLSKKMLVFGDSITEGAWVLGVHDDLTNYSLYEQASYAAGVASDLNAEYGNAAFGGLAWDSGFTGTPAFISSWNYILGTNSRLVGGLLSPAPDYILVNMGTNGGVSSGTVVSNWLTSVRAAAGANCKIYVIIPFNGTGSANITTGYNSYLSSSGDAKAFLINLGSNGVTYADSIPTYSYDGLHPNVAGHAALRTLVTAAIDTASTVTTQEPSGITGTTVTGNGNITDTGGVNPTIQGFAYATDSSSSHDCSVLGTTSTSYNSGSYTTGAYTTSITGLTANTYYCYEAYATKSVGTSYGSYVSFKTPITYTLTYSAGANGSIVGTSPQTVDSGSNGTLVTATPATGYHFVSWSDGYPTAARTDTNVTGNVTATASFAIDTYSLTVSKDGTGSGTTDVNSMDVNYGTNLDITATPNGSSTFSAWTGCDSVDANVCHLTNVMADHTIAVSFATSSTRSSKKKSETKTTSAITPVVTTVTNEIPTTEEVVTEITQTLHNHYVSLPVASFTTPTNGAGGAVSFDASSSTSNKGIIKYEWNFGDWDKAEGMKVEHEYKSPGRYTVTLTVTDRAGHKSTTTQIVDVKPIIPTITNIVAKGTALWIEGKSDPGTTIYFTIHSNPFEGQGLANKDGYWTYYLDNASEVLGAGDHTIFALAAVKLADNSELKSSVSKTYDFQMSVDNGKLKVEMAKTKTWKYISLGLVGVMVIGFLVLFLRRRRR